MAFEHPCQKSQYCTFGGREMLGIIYRVINTVNGKFYIGKTFEGEQARWARHVQDAKQGSRTRFHNAISKYGAAAFRVEHLDDTSNAADLSRLEQVYIEVSGARNPAIGYNITPGGDGAGRGPDHPSYGKPGPNRGRKFSAEVREKARKRQLGKRPSEQTRQRMSIASSGRKFSDTQKRNMSAAKVGVKNPRFGKPGTLSGRVFSVEHKRKLSLAHTGKTHSEETKRKQAASLRRRITSPTSLFRSGHPYFPRKSNGS